MQIARFALATLGGFVLFSLVEGGLTGHAWRTNLVFGAWTGALAAAVVAAVLLAVRGRRAAGPLRRRSSRPGGRGPGTAG